MHGTDAPAEVPAGPSSPRRSLWLRLLIVAICLLVIVLIAYVARDQVTLQKLAAHERQWRELQQSHPWFVFVAAFGIYAAVTGLSLPFATTLTLVYAWYFGFWRSLLLVNVASTTGATIAFLMSRYLLRDVIRDYYQDAWRKVDQHWQEEGAWYLFTLRLVPLIPFFLVNVLMGLTPIRTRTYWWVSQLGMLPATVLYTYAGSVVPSLQTLADRGVPSILSGKILAALALLGIFPLVVRRLFAKSSER